MAGRRPESGARDGDEAVARRRTSPSPTPTSVPVPAPVHVLDRPIDTTRVRRSAGDPTPTRSPAVSRIRSSPDSVIRRVIDDDAWRRHMATMTEGKSVTLWSASGAPIVLTIADGDVHEAEDGYPFPIGQDRIDEIKGSAEALPPHLRADLTLKAETTPAKDGFTVTEFPGERMSLVHHTNILKDATESHLTVENAHALAFHDLFGGAAPNDVRDKSEEDKRTINDTLTASGFGLLDNINFYPPTKDGSLEGVTLQQYVAFVANALLTGGAPQEYSDRFTALASEMSRRSKLDMGKLLLRSGKGDDKSLIKAVFIIESQLPGTKIVPDGSRKLFARWWQVKDNETKVAYLPGNLKKGSATPAEPIVWVKAGALAPSGDSYANLETYYCADAFKAFASAVAGFEPPAEVLARRVPEAKTPQPTGKATPTRTPRTGQPTTTNNNSPTPTGRLTQAVGQDTKKPATVTQSQKKPTPTPDVKTKKTTTAQQPKKTAKK
jgi:hypothetical protein